MPGRAAASAHRSCPPDSWGRAARAIQRGVVVTALHETHRPSLPSPRLSNATAGGGGWLQGPTHDVVMAFAWVPFAATAHLAANNPDHLRWVVSATLIFSFAHQPLSLWLVYGDPRQRHAHRALFTWAPVIAVAAIAAGTAVQPVAVALVAGVWNLAHTIRQRYGISRLYGRLSGIECGGDNRLLWSWLTMAVLIALATTDLGSIARQVGLGSRNLTAIDMLGSARFAARVLLPVVGAAVIVLTARAVRTELRRSGHSAARLTYLGSSAVLMAVLAADPVTGFVAYVGSHAAEYLLMVRWRVDRAARGTTAGDRVGGLARRIGGTGTLALYALAVAALIVGIGFVESGVAVTVALTLGALHLLYDGFIWRTPRPATVDGSASVTHDPITRGLREGGRP